MYVGIYFDHFGQKTSNERNLLQKY